MGLGETVKGAIKQGAGNLTGNKDLEQEGEAQQTKGNAETAETEHKVKAQSAESEAQGLEEQAKNL